MPCMALQGCRRYRPRQLRTRCNPSHHTRRMCQRCSPHTRWPDRSHHRLDQMSRTHTTMMRCRRTAQAGMARKRPRWFLRSQPQISPTHIRCSRQRCHSLRNDPMGRSRKAWKSWSQDPSDLRRRARTETRGRRDHQQRACQCCRRHRVCCRCSHRPQYQPGKLACRCPYRCRGSPDHDRRRTGLHWHTPQAPRCLRRSTRRRRSPRTQWCCRSPHPLFPQGIERID